MKKCWRQSVLCRARVVLCAALLVIVACPNVSAQQQEEKTPGQLLDDFAHYAIVVRIDMAEASARALLDSGITPAELVILLDEGPVSPERLEAALSRAITIPELEDIAGELSTTLEQGRLDLARDQDRINGAIEMLTGTPRQRHLADGRLRAAGEYAVPALLRQITDGKDARLREASQVMLRQIGLPAVMPLSEAVQHLGDAAAQRIVCDILGDIRYAHAAPFLIELRNDSATARPVREAADRALARIDVRHPDLSAAYTALARNFFNDAQFLIPRPTEPSNNLWRYDHTIGLTPIAIPTEIFGRVMAMRFASKGLDLNPSNAQALSLFVAANLKRENDLQPGTSDPIYGELEYSPAFYATAFGTRTCMDVLGMAIDIGDTPLVRDAIEALAKTTGGANLFSFGNGRQPLLEAIRYPDRRVQYEASLALARALPQQSFGGDFSVVSILASAVRTGDQLFALVVGDIAEDRADVARRVEPLGFDIVGSESELAALRDAADFAVGVDLIVMRMSSVERTYEMVEQLRRLPKLSVAPILVIVEQVEVPSVRNEYQSNPRIGVTRPDVSDAAWEHIVDDLMDRTAGGRMTEAEAEAYAIEALAALRDIAISGSSVYDIREAEVALLDALDSRTGGTRTLVANILALVDSPRAQQDLFEAAMVADEFERLDLLAATAESVRRFGNHLRDYQITALADLVSNSSGETAEAAAQLHGSLNLPTQTALDLIP